MADLFATVTPLHGALDYHLQRQNILISNVAHVDTPGYVPRDLARASSTQFANTFQIALAKTQGGHLEGAEGSAPAVGRIFEDPSAGAGNDRNFVSLDRESAKVAANQVRFDVVSALVSAEFSDIAFVANDARGA